MENHTSLPAEQPPAGLLDRPWVTVAVTGLAALAVISPAFFLGNASGHDFEFHIRSWMDVARQWQQGVLFPRWAAWANFGYGEPRFIFYPPMSWVLGAALGQILPWRMVPGAEIWICLVLAGACMRPLAREWLGPRDALTASVLYAVNPYHLLIIYYRSDFAELLAAAFIPVAFLGAIWAARGGRKGAVRLALGIAAVWLSNAPTAVITTYSAVIIVIFVAIRERSVKPLAVGGTGVGLGLSLAGLYIVPAAYEQPWVNIREVLSSELQPVRNFLFAKSNDPDFVLFNHKVSYLAILLICLTAIGAVVTARWRRESLRLWDVAALLGVIAVLLMFPISAPAWNWVPKLRFVQFPWRWLLILDVSFALFLAGAAAHFKRLRIVEILIALILVGSATILVRNAWWDSEDVPNNLAAVTSGAGYEGSDEYAPRGCDHYDLQPGGAQLHVETAPAELSMFPPRAEILRWMPEEKVFEVDSEVPAKAELNLVNYPAWHAAVNNKEVPIHSAPGTDAMFVSVPAGFSQVIVVFRPTTDRLVGGILSALSLLVLAYLNLTIRPESRERPK